MEKRSISFKKEVLETLNRVSEHGRRSEYIGSTLEHRWREIQRCLSSLQILGITNENILAACDSISLSDLPMVGMRAHEMSKRIFDKEGLIFGYLCSGNEMVAYALATIKQELVIGNIELERRLS